MKFLTLIFSIYLLVLSCVPCADKDECNINMDIKTTISSTTKENPKKSDEACTPFCTCSHCSASAYYQPLNSYKIPKRIFPTTKYPVYDVSYNSQVFFSIWQPPKKA
ncbi:DUF6660 family protein [Parasediminibacterium paludis]|uniref:DUF6660 family protein n=1 Tax=Parasediminibacterium paludis TaxID=908966 RepID=A0ABV8Q299_9BACT